MNCKAKTRWISDQLSYNLLYAPDYPQEDKTNLERQEQIIQTSLDELINSVRREDIGDWVRLGSMSVTSAFKKFRANQNSEARKDIESAIAYLKNSLDKKPHRATFISNPINQTTSSQ